MQHDEFRARLESALAQVIAELEQLGIQHPTTGDWIATPTDADLGSADENVAADVTEDWNTKRAILAQLETRYRNITRALQKINDGTFGICEISGEPIEPERLEAHPTARTNLANLDREKELSL